jgi:uncharacterized membrane protein YqjE
MKDEANGHASPGVVMRDRFGNLAKDVVALAELQTELFQVEVSEWARTCVAPIVVLAAVTVVISLASLPLLLLSLAYCLAEFGGLSMALSALIAGGVGLLVAAACLFAAWRVAKKQQGALTRFRIEFVRNMRWLKQMLTRPTKASQQDNR